MVRDHVHVAADLLGERATLARDQWHVDEICRPVISPGRHFFDHDMGGDSEVDGQIAEVPHETADAVLLNEILTLRCHVPRLLRRIAIMGLEKNVVVQRAIHEQGEAVPPDPVVDLASFFVSEVLVGLRQFLVVVDVAHVARRPQRSRSIAATVVAVQEQALLSCPEQTTLSASGPPVVHPVDRTQRSFTESHDGLWPNDLGCSARRGAVDVTLSSLRYRRFCRLPAHAANSK